MSQRDGCVACARHPETPGQRPRPGGNLPGLPGSCLQSCAGVCGVLRRKSCLLLAVLGLGLVMVSELSVLGRYLDPGGLGRLGESLGRYWEERGDLWRELQEKSPGGGLGHKNHNSSLPLCPFKPPNLVGRIPVLDARPSWSDLHGLFPSLSPGGRWRPRGCQAREKLALILPYRDRELNLRAFLRHMHPFLQKQQLDYGIYVVEQGGAASFNRGLLLNIGFHHALKMYNYTCFAFHDVDMVPEMDNNLYRCSDIPIHLSSAQDRFKWRVPYPWYFGGAELFSREQYIKINGYSNRYFGWGGEDDDLYHRLKAVGYKMARYTEDVARYRNFDTGHKRAPMNKERYAMVDEAEKYMNKDGLNTMVYKILGFKEKELYTWIHVDIPQETIMNQKL